MDLAACKSGTVHHAAIVARGRAVAPEGAAHSVELKVAGTRCDVRPLEGFRRQPCDSCQRRRGHHVDTMPKTRKAASRRPSHNALISLRKIGAGEGIRTLDPNLGKVVLYP